MKKHWCVFLIINLLPVVIYAQNEFYSIGSTISTGIKLVDGGDIGNSRFCQVKKGDEVIKYSPFEVKEFGFKDGRIYLSKDIQISDSVQKVFLEQLVIGHTKLYYYRGKNLRMFFIEKDSTLLVELPKRNEDGDIGFRDNLQNITSDCQNVNEAVKFVGYNKKHLTELITRYNKCIYKPYPFFKYGMSLGYETTRLVPSPGIKNEYISQLDFTYTGGVTIGFFADIPVSLSNFSLHTELYYSKHGFSYNQLIGNKDIDFVANISSLKLPVLIRYVYPNLLNKIRPFINAGGIAGYNFKKNGSIYEATITQTKVEINDVLETTLIDKNQIGYAVGGGIEFKLNNRNHLFFELRYNKLYCSSNSVSMNNSEFHFITGINF